MEKTVDSQFGATSSGQSELLLDFLKLDVHLEFSTSWVMYLTYNNMPYVIFKCIKTLYSVIDTNSFKHFTEFKGSLGLWVFSSLDRYLKYHRWHRHNQEFYFILASSFSTDKGREHVKFFKKENFAPCVFQK